MLLLWPILAFLIVVLIAASLYAIPIAIATALALVVAILIWRRWPTTTRMETLGKIAVLGCMVIAVDLAVLAHGVSRFMQNERDYRTMCNAQLAAAKAIMDDPVQLDRLQKSMAFAAAVTQPICRQEVERQVSDRFRASDPNEDFSAADLDVAWQAFKQKSPQLDLCDSGASAYVVIQLRQKGPAGALDLIQSFPTTQAWCGARDNYIFQLGQRCAGVWKERCANELPRAALQQLAQDPQMRAWLPKLVRDVWGK